MALHGDNEGSREADRNENVNPMHQMTMALQEAYVKAGEDMGKQMAAAIVAIVTDMTAGQGQPLLFAWPKTLAPKNVLDILPEETTQEGRWIIILAPELLEVPLFEGEPIWNGELTSGHKVLVLA